MEPSTSDDLAERVRELDAALTHWKALLLLADLQRRAYLEQATVEPAGEGERLYRGLARRLAAEVLQLRARVAALESREEPPPCAHTT